MDFKDSPEESKFRKQVGDWLHSHIPREWRASGFGLDMEPEERFRFFRAWQKTLYEGGWVGLSWPREYGGRGATLMEQVIFNEESARARAPLPLNVIGLNMVGPTIIVHGTEEQKRRFLPGILTANEIWSQGYSEPDAGSDLASLRTRAEIQGDRYIVNGQKVWMTFGSHADWCMLLARSDPTAPKHQGLICLLVDMHAPGVTVRPLVQMTGEAEFGEVFFENVEVPRTQAVGEPGQGWTIAITTLLHERGTLTLSVQVTYQQVLDALVALAKKTLRRGRPAIEDPIIRQRLAQCHIDVRIMRLTAYRGLTRTVREGTPGPEGSIGKLHWTEINQRMQELAMDIQGHLGVLIQGSRRAVDNGRWQYGFLRSRANTIEAGTSEIQRNILGERVLGLPKG